MKRREVGNFEVVRPGDGAHRQAALPTANFHVVTRMACKTEPGALEQLLRGWFELLWRNPIGLPEPRGIAEAMLT
jgi:hypothetical protein